MDKICMRFDCVNRNNSGYCKTTACINPKYSNISTEQYGQGVQKRIVTNADRIRAMTDEQLSHFIADLFMQFRRCPEDENWDRSVCLVDRDCAVCWFEWLRQEADT